MQTDSALVSQQTLISLEPSLTLNAKAMLSTDYSLSRDDQIAMLSK